MSVSNLVCIVGVYSWIDSTHYTHIIPAHIQLESAPQLARASYLTVVLTTRVTARVDLTTQ